MIDLVICMGKKKSMTYVCKFIRQMQLIFEQKTAAEICSTDRKFH